MKRPARKVAKQLKTITLIVLTSILLLNIATQIRADQNLSLSGFIVDPKGKPVKHALIFVLRKIGFEEWKFICKRRSNSSGYYQISLPMGTYRILIFADYNETPGYDYAVRMLDIELSRDTRLNITMIYGASIKVIGKALAALSPEPARHVTYRVKLKDERLNKNVLTIFGAELEGAIPTGIQGNLIVVPANTEVTVIAEAHFVMERTIEEISFNLTSKPVKLDVGEEQEIIMTEASLRHSLKQAVQELRRAEYLVYEAEEKGFQISIMKAKLARISELIEKAKRELQAKMYDKAFVDLREAWLLTNHLENKVLQMEFEASSSTSTIIAIIALTSIALGEILFEKRTLKIASSSAIYILMIALLQVLYPGCKLISIEEQIRAAITAYIAFNAMIIGVEFVKGKVSGESLIVILSSIASISKRNLKRRKLRTIITAVTVTVIIGGFIALTSIAIEEGLITNESPWRGEFKGLMVLGYGAKSEIMQFIPINERAIEKFDLKSGVEWISYKYETIPQLRPLAILSSSKNMKNAIQIYSVIAYSSTKDILAKLIQKHIKKGGIPERSGEVLLTESAASILKVDVKDNIIVPGRGLIMKVVGIASDEVLNEQDIDGRRIQPYKLIIVDGENPTLEVVDCEASEVIFMWWEDAVKLGALPSRLIAHTANSDKAVTLAKKIALSGEYKTYAYCEDKVIMFAYGSYLHARGLEAITLFGISIANVGIVMLSSVYERKREVAILSALGLNPSHIALIFALEATFIGIIGGGLAYLMGLSLYCVTRLLNIGFEVYPKVSASWTFSAIVLSIASVIAGTIPALKSSIIVTPSKLMRWKADLKPERAGEPWVFYIPVKVSSQELDSLIKCIIDKLKAIKEVEGLKLLNRHHIRFRMIVSRGTLGSAGSVNELYPSLEDGELKIKLLVKSFGEDPDKHAHEVAKLIRSIILRWRSTGPSY